MEGRRGRDPAIAVDVEQLVNALDLLRERHDLEIAPFVTWDGFIDTLDLSLFPNEGVSAAGRELDSLLRKRSSDTERFVRALQKRDFPEVGNEPVAFAKEALVKALVRTVWRDSYDAHPFIVQALKSKTVRAIATLNYDNVVEYAATVSGIEGKRNFDQPGGPEHLLLKLHGSANWFWNADESATGNVIDTVPDHTTEDDAAWRRRHWGPALLFGSRAKLIARGPFLDLLFAFRRELEHAARVVVIGYSFRDEHINEYLFAWLQVNREAGLIIIDPGIHDLERFFGLGDHILSSKISQMRLLAFKAADAMWLTFPE